jgi:hypothetical protein
MGNKVTRTHRNTCTCSPVIIYVTYFSTLKINTVHSSEVMVNYQTARRHIPKDIILPALISENLSLSVLHYPNRVCELQIGLCGFDSRQGKRFIFSLLLHTGSMVHSATYPIGSRSSFPRVMRPGRQTDHLPPTCAGVTNTWNYTSTSPYLMTWCLIKQRRTVSIYFIRQMILRCAYLSEFDIANLLISSRGLRTCKNGAKLNILVRSFYALSYISGFPD